MATKKSMRPREAKTKESQQVITPVAPAIVEPHAWTDGGEKVLILRRINRDGTSNSKRLKDGIPVEDVPFAWPDGTGCIVTADDWDPSCRCGGGLHGWPWGMGLGDGCDYSLIDDRWLVLEALPQDVIGGLREGWKCKCRQATKIYDGSFSGAWSLINGGRHRLIEAMSKVTPNNSSTAASSGNSSTAASSGNSSKAASSGNYSTAASSGYSSTAASSGNYSKAASLGDYSTAASSGDYSKAEAAGGHNCAAVVGAKGKCKVGDKGAFALAFWDETEGWRFLCGKVGENGIKPDTWYKIENKSIVEA